MNRNTGAVNRDATDGTRRIPGTDILDDARLGQTKPPCGQHFHNNKIAVICIFVLTGGHQKVTAPPAFERRDATAIIAGTIPAHNAFGLAFGRPERGGHIVIVPL